MFNSPIVSARYKYVLSLIFCFFDLIDKPSPLDEEKKDFLVTCLGTIIVSRSLTVFFKLSVIFLIISSSPGCVLAARNILRFFVRDLSFFNSSDIISSGL